MFVFFCVAFVVQKSSLLLLSRKIGNKEAENDENRSKSNVCKSNFGRLGHASSMVKIANLDDKTTIENNSIKNAAVQQTTKAHRRQHSCPIPINDNQTTIINNKPKEPARILQRLISDDNNVDNRILKTANVIDYIHELQNFYDSNLLDKENSHFLIADLAINTIEFLKEKELKNSTDKVSLNKIVSGRFSEYGIGFCKYICIKLAPPNYQRTRPVWMEINLICESFISNRFQTNTSIYHCL